MFLDAANGVLCVQINNTISTLIMHKNFIECNTLQ